METLQLVGLLTVFLVLAALMFLRKLPALVALPLLAFLVALIGGVRFDHIVEYVFGHGAIKLHQAYTVAMFGSALSVMMQKTGVAESFIKKGAELGGDNPWIIAALMFALITMLFSTLGGLGAIIMVATIVLPIMSSVGVGSLTAAGVFLLGLSIGGTLNVGNWAVYVDVMGLTVSEIRPFALTMFGVATLAALLYITIQLYRDGHDLKLTRIAVWGGALAALAGAAAVGYFHLLDDAGRNEIGDGLSTASVGATWTIGVALAALFLYALYRAVRGLNDKSAEPHWTSYLSPVTPLFLILFFDVHFIAAFVVGLVYAFVATHKRGSFNVLVQSIFEGGAAVMPAVVMMFGIGMLLVAIMGPSIPLADYPGGWPTLELVKPALRSVAPTTAISYVLVFSLAAPLALYRGPLNVWGMGYGLAAALIASGLEAGAVMGLLLAVGQIQGVSDPTNTHNVWLANELRVDVQKILWNTIPYTWAVAVIGLAIAALMFI
jgi:hypothetical protein